MTPAQASEIIKEAAGTLAEAAANRSEDAPDVAAQLRALSEALSRFQRQVAVLQPEDLVRASEAVNGLLQKLISVKRVLDGDDARTVAGAVQAVFNVKRYVDGEGLGYFKRMRRMSPRRKLAVIVASVVLAVVGGAAVGAVFLIRYMRERKARLKNRMLSSKVLRGQVAFEVLESGQIMGAKKMGELLAAELANNTYSFLIKINDALVAPNQGVFTRSDGAARRLQVNARTAEKMLELNFGGGVNCQFLLPEVPVYRFFTLHIAVADGVVRVYVDGDLRRTFYLHTCGAAVPSQSGATVEFGTQPNVVVRYFKYVSGEMESYAIRQEAYVLLREIQAQLHDAQVGSCGV